MVEGIPVGVLGQAASRGKVLGVSDMQWMTRDAFVAQRHVGCSEHNGLHQQLSYCMG